MLSDPLLALLHRHLSGLEAPVGHWRAQAACRVQDLDVFFPVGEISGDWEAPKVVCARCPARLACLAFAVATNQEYGVWGGMTETERRQLRRAWRAAEDLPIGTPIRPFRVNSHLKGS